MAITVDSSQWTGKEDDTTRPGPIVWGEFADDAARATALRQLESAGLVSEDTADIHHGEAADNADQVDAPDQHPKEADVRNKRQLHVGTAMAATSMAAAGLVIATGGAALPAVAAAAAAGAATAAVGETAVTAAETGMERSKADTTPEPTPEGPVIGLRVVSEGAEERAEALLREAGARRIWVSHPRI